MDFVIRHIVMRCFLLLLTSVCAAAAPIQLSGIYPHLAYFNEEAECGTGAVVPWANRLWVVTYAPHKPAGSTDKLYEITPELELIARPESIGGTPANRMIHRESRQLFIGPHAIDAERNVRTIPYAQMYGRHTGNARHLFDPANKIYYATMEEGFYEVDVHTLEVTELWRDMQQPGGRKANLPGYHGKGLFSGQGRLIYANNGEKGKAALEIPETPSGALAEWDGKADHWTVVRRNQFTEVTGPGGIFGNSDVENDPVWSIGWDHRSLILKCLHQGKWHAYRLPKASHSYDGAHGWNTEWPRIREIGETDLLMTMHGTFWRFPKTFSPARSAGIAPRSNYLKVIGDFCEWNGRIVFGCDDTAANEFLNTRKAKGKIAAPQSQSNLWFVEPAALDHLGPAIGRGSVWINERVNKGEPSDPYLFSGYDLRGVHLAHDHREEVVFSFEVDRRGDGIWEPLGTVAVPPGSAAFHAFETGQSGAWVRVKSSHDCNKASAAFTYRNQDRRDAAGALFDGLAEPGRTNVHGGLVRARSSNKRDLAFSAVAADGSELGYYELDAQLRLVRREDGKALEYQKTHTAIPAGVIQSDAASVVFIDDEGKRWRLPKGDSAFDNGGTFGSYRAAREVATERDLFNAHGTFYELPARNAGGFSRVRPVATHNRMIHDFCSYRGLIILSGVANDATAGNPHIRRSDDGQAALWVGAADDLWRLGKPRGKGGPWLRTTIKAGDTSDPYLMTAYDKKNLTLSADQDVTVTMEIDIAGDGTWVVSARFPVNSGEAFEYKFPEAFSAYWVRFTADADCTATAQLDYQ
jgi:hypothetical protein